ncbi:MAG TPA: crosslink repair DNA glycosylase YcaQ family protein [Anaerolineales bacterium]|nr:crosslink repair DNA glycosylase YcaQ family protein [Anaerolineales bacterium]
MPTVYPLTALRALALHAQGLTTPNGQEPPSTPDAICKAVRQVGCVQIDTLQMVHRSHYLTLWSRLGSYDPADFDRLAYNPAERRIFEGWQRCASLIPLEDYRYQMPQQNKTRLEPSDWYRRWLTQEGNPQMVEEVLEYVRQNGPTRPSDFEYDGPRRGSWWDWKPAKVALEFLYAFGDLMIAERVKFQRIYDLTERVLPGWVDTTPPSPEERDRYWIELGARALGVCQPLQAADYAYRKRTPSRAIIQGMLKEGVLVPVQGQLANGSQAEMIVHRDHQALLEQAASGALPARRTTFLSPFDSLFWARDRDQHLWAFEQALECYKPAPQRIWGYYCLPILHHERLVGRFDPKLERQAGRLRLKALYLEPGVLPDEELVTGTAAALRDFLSFHKARDLVIERSQPEEFGLRLLKAL